MGETGEKVLPYLIVWKLRQLTLLQVYFFIIQILRFIDDLQ